MPNLSKENQNEYMKSEVITDLINDGYFEEGQIKDLKFNRDDTITIYLNDGSHGKYEYHGGRLFPADHLTEAVDSRWYTGDFSDNLMDAWNQACDSLNVWSEPSVQSGQGVDVLRDNDSGETLYEIDFDEECQFMDDLDEQDWDEPNAMENTVEAICEFIGNYKMQDEEQEAGIEQEIKEDYLDTLDIGDDVILGGFGEDSPWEGLSGTIVWMDDAEQGSEYQTVTVRVNFPTIEGTKDVIQNFDRKNMKKEIL